MTPLHLNIVTAAGGTRRETFAQSPVTFGRAPDNHVVVEEDTASRHHGELRWEDDHWSLVNLSPNGTQVNGREAGRRPVRLGGGETVAVGGRPLFRVIVQAEVVGGGDDEAPAYQGGAPAPKSKRRVTIWALIGVYLALMLGLIVFLTTLGKGNRQQQIALSAELTPDQIAAAVTAPVTVPALDPAKSQRCLDQANQAYDQISVWPRNTYEAYHNYRLALAYAGRDAFEPGDNQLRYQTVEHRLIDAVTRQYHLGYECLRSGDYNGASDAFRYLNYDLYPVSNSIIYLNAEAHRNSATKRLNAQHHF